MHPMTTKTNRNHSKTPKTMRMTAKCPSKMIKDREEGDDAETLWTFLNTMMADIRAFRCDTSITTKHLIIRHNNLVLKQSAEMSSLQAQVRTLEGSIRSLRAILT